MNNSCPLVSVLVLNYNGERIIERCLSSIFSQDYPNYEVIVIDNASNDNSVKILKKYVKSANAKLVLNKKNLGYAAGLNQGYKFVSKKARFIAIVTNDVLVSCDWIRQMILPMMEDELTAAVSSHIFDAKAKAILSELRIIYPCGWYYIPRNKELGLNEIDFPSGEAFIVRKEVFENVGMFDQDYFGYYDDADLGWRIRLLGFKIKHNPDAHIVHRRSYSFRRMPKYILQFLFHRNRITSCIKNLETLSLPIFLIGEALTLISWSFFQILMGKNDTGLKGYQLALAYIFLQGKRILKKRKLVQADRRIRDADIFRSSMPSSRFASTGMVYIPRNLAFLVMTILRLITIIFLPMFS